MVLRPLAAGEFDFGEFGHAGESLTGSFWQRDF